MRTITIFILSILLHVSAFAIEETKIATVMQGKIDFATSVLQKKELNIKQKAQEIFEEIESTFDFSLMARLALGQYWNSIDKEKQNSFIPIFEKYMKKSYIDKLELYTNEKIIVKEAKKIKENRIWLYTELQGEKETFDIIYKFYENSAKDWLIYDVDIIGVSIIKTYKAQFEDTIANNSFDYLVEKIQNIK
jgi:phospholipid transport system substrate-binding protein